MKDSFHYLDDPRRKRPALPEVTNAVANNQPITSFESPSRPYYAEPDSSGKLIEYIRIFYRNKWTLSLISFLGLAAALALSLPQKPVYRGHALLEIQDYNENFLNKGFDNAPQQGDAAETNFQTQIRLLQSDSLLDRVATKLKLRDPAGERKPRPSLFRTLLHLPPPPVLPERERLLKQIQANLTVRVVGQTRIVEVLYDSADPALAASVPNTLITEFIEQSQELRWDSTKKTSDWLTLQLAEMKVKLGKSAAQLSDMAKASGRLSDSGKDTIEQEKLRQMEDELAKAQAESLSREARLELAKRTPTESLPEVLDDPIIRDYRLKLTDLQRQRVELSSTLTPAHYKVRQVEDQITELREALARERGNMLNRIQNEYDAAKRHEDLLAKACDEQTRLVAKESDKAVQYNLLKQEVDTSRQLYETLLQRVKEAGVASAMRASNILLIDPARPPLMPYKPNFIMNSAIGLFGGLFAGVGVIFFREQSNKIVRTPSELSTQLNVPELGSIPEIRSRFTLGRPFAKPVSRKLFPASDGERSQNPGSPELMTWNRKPSVVAESFRATLPSILFSGSSEVRPRVIVMTSPNPGEGKTTIATNLAIAISEITHRVLIMDADLRRPRLHQIFGLSNDGGLSDLLNSDEPITAAKVEQYLQDTDVPGLVALTSGKEKQDASKLFYSRRLPELLQILKEEFDTLVIDSPPILQVPDSRLLGRFADGLIMVIRSGYTEKESALMAYQRLAEDGSRILGTIFNSWDAGIIHRYAYAGRK